MSNFGKKVAHYFWKLPDPMFRLGRGALVLQHDRMYYFSGNPTSIPNLRIMPFGVIIVFEHCVHIWSDLTVELVSTQRPFIFGRFP